MAGLCGRASIDEPLKTCDKPATHILTIKSVTNKTFRCPVCDEHYAEGNQSAARLRIATKS